MMKKVWSLLIMLIVVLAPLSHMPANAEAVEADTEPEQQLKMQEPISFPDFSYNSTIEYLGTANGLLYFKVPYSGKSPRNEKKQMLLEYIVTINAKTNTIQWKLPIYGGFNYSDRTFFDEAGNLYCVIGAGLKQPSNETFLYSVSPKGVMKWQTLFPDFVDKISMINNKIIVTYRDEITAVNPDGKVAWKKSFKSRDAQKYSYWICEVASNEILTTKSEFYSAKSVSFDVFDQNLKKKFSFPLNSTSTVEQALKFNNDVYILKIKISKSTKQLVAVGANGKAKWTKKIDPTTATIYIVDGKLMFANNTGFYVLNGKGEQLNHTPLAPLSNSSLGYKVRLDDRYISILPDYMPEGKTALTVLDRKSYKTLYSFASPFTGGEQPVYYDELFIANDNLYMVYFNKLFPLK
ncbi:hypothetical protein [Paenibacillus sp. FSL P4-0288]|uniref:hypothetical protein n=1 Tax=Paenibacillus sp. FSL P4-0288 TaxID=2921633 RepID=UPI0030FA4AF0